MEAILNEQGQSVYPVEAVAFVDDPKAVFDSKLYESLKTGSSPDAQVDPAAAATAEKPPAPETVVSKTETPALDLDALIKERTKGKFEKFDDVLSKAEKPFDYANDTSRILHEAIQKGESDKVHEILGMQRLLSNIDKLSPADQLKVKIQLENPEWTPEQVNADFDLEYSLDADLSELPEDKVVKLKAKHEKELARAAKAAKAYFDTVKAEIKLPDYKSANPEMEAWQNDQKKYNEMNAALLTSLEKDISSFKDIDLSFSDKDVSFDHRFEVADEEKKQVADRLKDYGNFFITRYYKDGQWQVGKMLQDQYVQDNLPTIIKSAVSKARTATKVETVREMANADPGKPAVNTLDLSAEAARAAKLAFLMA